MKHIRTRKLVVQREVLLNLGVDRLKLVAGGSVQQSVPGHPCGTTHVTKDPGDEQ